jgi:signal transduction histidine kinase
MFRQLLNWRTLLALIAILIVSGTIFYSQYLAKKIAKDERKKVEQWAEASRSLLDPAVTDTRLPFKIIQDNTDIPIIQTNGKDSILGFINLDSAKAANEPAYLPKELRKFKTLNDPFVDVDPLDPTKMNYYYYGHTKLLNQVRYYPLVQLFIVALFIAITLISLRSSYRSTQNQVWAGMAKETAHQLGTPVSSLEGWVEMLKENPANDKITAELEKDVNRLRLVSDRFGKIGSTPHLEAIDIVKQVTAMVDYMKKRATGKINFLVNTHNHPLIVANISAPLFDWVIENLLKNALDAMEGKGAITVDMQETVDSILIDVTDSGKGISKKNIDNVFKPGFTTKKRGWGLGLSLCKRIVEQYHKGKLFVKHSELGKGTTFRIVLKKENQL